MILKRYGTSFHSVEPNFDSKALTEIGFRRDRQLSVPVEEMERDYELVATHELVAQADGEVQDHTEQELLDRLEGSLNELLGKLAEGEVLVFENGDGHDYPKTKQRTRTLSGDGDHRLQFSYTVAPPLRMGHYRRH